MAKFRGPKVQRARPYAGQRRVTRSPKHPFQLRTKPFQIQPFLLSPVLPGGTLSNLVLQSRVVSKPLKHALMGWWCEYYFFYVKPKDIVTGKHRNKEEHIKDKVKDLLVHSLTKTL